MRNAIALFFISLYVVAMLQPIAPIVDYVANYDYIAKVLCINKENTQVQCNGKCHLKKELKKVSGDSETEKGFPVGTKISLEDYPIGFIQLFQFQPFAVAKNVAFTSNNYFLQKGYINQLFRPPC